MYLHSRLILRLCFMMQRNIIPCFFILLMGVCTITAQPGLVFAESRFVSDEDEEPEMEDESKVNIVGKTPLNITDLIQIQQQKLGMQSPVEFIEAPVIQLIYGLDVNGNERIEVAQNRLLTDEHGKLTVLVDTRALREDMREEGFLQLAMKYRSNCGQFDWRQPLTQKTASEPYANNMYVLTIDLCKQNANKVVFIETTGEKNLRSTASKIGSAVSYLLLAKGYTMLNGAPDGDNGNFFETTASTLPAAAVLQGLDQITEYQQGFDEISGIAPCLTALYARVAMQKDRGFLANTGKLFTSDGIRHFTRSGTYTQWYKCMQLLTEDNLLYPMRKQYVESSNHQLNEHDVHHMTQREAEDYFRQNNPGAARSSSVEFASSLFTSVASTTLLIGADHYSGTRSHINRLNAAGKGYLESLPYGLELRGGVASSPYRSWETVDMGISALSQPANFNDLSISEVWASAPNIKDTLWELRYKGLQYGLIGAVWLGSAYSAYSTVLNAKKLGKGKQMLENGFLHAVNWMELAGYLAMNEVKMQVTKPLVTMITDAAIEREMLTRGSFWHSAANAGLQVSFQFGLSMIGVEATRLAGHQFKLPTEAAKGAQALTAAAADAAKNSNLMVDILTGTTTNGMVLPLVLMLDEHLLIPVMDKGSAYFCRAYEWGITCPGHEVSLGVTVLPYSNKETDNINFNQVVYKKPTPPKPVTDR